MHSHTREVDSTRYLRKTDACGNFSQQIKIIKPETEPTVRGFLSLKDGCKVNGI